MLRTRTDYASDVTPLTWTQSARGTREEREHVLTGMTLETSLDEVYYYYNYYPNYHQRIISPSHSIFRPEPEWSVTSEID